MTSVSDPSCNELSNKTMDFESDPNEDEFDDEIIEINESAGCFPKESTRKGFVWNEEIQQNFMNNYPKGPSTSSVDEIADVLIVFPSIYVQKFTDLRLTRNGSVEIEKLSDLSGLFWKELCNYASQELDSFFMERLKTTSDDGSENLDVYPRVTVGELFLNRLAACGIKLLCKRDYNKIGQLLRSHRQYFRLSALIGFNNVVDDPYDDFRDCGVALTNEVALQLQNLSFTIKYLKRNRCFYDDCKHMYGEVVPDTGSRLKASKIGVLGKDSHGIFYYKVWARNDDLRFDIIDKRAYFCKYLAVLSYMKYCLQ